MSIYFVELGHSMKLSHHSHGWSVSSPVTLIKVRERSTR